MPSDDPHGCAHDGHGCGVLLHARGGGDDHDHQARAADAPLVHVPHVSRRHSPAGGGWHRHDAAVRELHGTGAEVLPSEGAATLSQVSEAGLGGVTAEQWRQVRQPLLRLNVPRTRVVAAHTAALSPPCSRCPAGLSLSPRLVAVVVVFAVVFVIIVAVILSFPCRCCCCCAVAVHTTRRCCLPALTSPATLTSSTTCTPRGRLTATPRLESRTSTSSRCSRTSAPRHLPQVMRRVSCAHKLWFQGGAVAVAVTVIAVAVIIVVVVSLSSVSLSSLSLSRSLSQLVLCPRHSLSRVGTAPHPSSATLICSQFCPSIRVQAPRYRW
jgi:hypothetical protein